MTEQSIFSCFVEPDITDSVLDCLLCQPYVSGFSVQQIDGYSKDHASYTVTEQVAGYRAICRIDIRLEKSEIHALTSAIKQLDLQHSIRYWVTPVIEFGSI